MASLFPPPITASNKEKCTVLQEGGASNLQYKHKKLALMISNLYILKSKNV